MYVSSTNKELELNISPQDFVLLTDQEDTLDRADHFRRQGFHLINRERCVSNHSDANANAWLTARLIVKETFRQQREVGMNISAQFLDSHHWGHGPGMEKVGVNLVRGVVA